MKIPCAVCQRATSAAGAVLLTLLVLSLPQSNAEANIYVVDRVDDPLVIDIVSACTIINLPDCSLRSAIRKANAHANGTSGPDTIVIPAGIYTLSQGGVDDVAVLGDLDITDSVIITAQTGATADNTIIDANAIDRVFDVRGTAVVSLSGLTITGGSCPSSTGGGIRVAETAELELTRSTVHGNLANSGGGLSNYGTLSVTASVVRGNTALALGGGIAAWGTLYLTVTDSEVGPANTAVDGGGIYNTSFHALLYASSIWGNTASGDGGGVFNDDGMVAENCSFYTNTASGGSGGAIFNDHYLQLKSVTITGNLASLGAALSSSDGSTFGVVSTIIQGACTDHGADWTSYGGNLESPGNSCGLDHASEPVDQVLVTDPMLGDLGYHGGLTRHFALRRGSPAVDVALNCPDHDQRRQPRPQDGDGDGSSVCDAGAHELIHGYVFMDGFETGNVAAWSSSAP